MSFLGKFGVGKSKTRTDVNMTQPEINQYSSNPERGGIPRPPNVKSAYQNQTVITESGSRRD